MEGSGVQNLEPFIIQRYLSFIQNRGIILILNNFLNSKISIFQDKKRFYKTCMELLPKMSKQYITYIKKTKSKKDSQEEIKNLACKEYRISKKELEDYISIDPSVLKEFEQVLDLYKK